MKSACPGLWKQIGSQTHKKEHLARIASNKLTYEPHVLKYENQQINITLHESAINIKLNDLEVEENQRDCIEELKLFKLGRKMTASSDVLNRMLKELPEIKEQSGRVDEETQKNSIAYTRGIEEKVIRTCKLVKSIAKQLHREVNQLKLNIGSVLTQVCVDLNKEVRQLQGKYHVQFQTVSESYKGKCLELDGLQKLYLEKIQKQKQYQIKLVNNQKQITRQRTQIQKLRNEAENLCYERMTKFRQNTELSQKVFDLEQKMAGFDLRVQEAVQLAFEKFNNRAHEEKAIQNNYQHNLKTHFTQWHQSPLKKPFSENHFPYEPKYVQSKFASPKRNLSYAQPDDKVQQEKQIQNKFFTKRLEKLLEKDMYESHPLNKFKSPNKYGSSSDFFRTEQHSERLKTTNSKQLLKSHNYSSFTKKQPQLKQVKKEGKVDNISQKINKIRAKIESQIKNITVYKQKK